ncbi:flavodoxin family protein [Gilliamella sp. Pra-s65]|uniref:NAD(P)H-dependent oxidoreductase n=1 Tax=unclassified Gilliamella TaxID=2685620 RepID=UPI00136650EE|nr:MULTISPECIES: NAD(P)H-dependent oxidoreductase [unclassified Gilliamella]MWN90268.1 flavodoxin family protein [Gilliamella sp. Pra-s65]MWP73275.1 flavodoxin family protein [Gilliamella sp. Pra-s52]
MALIILGHPNIKQSTANKTIIETLQNKVEDIEIRNIHNLYPNYQINVQEEQAALLRHDLIILQYPMYWYNMPAILKIWFDEVFTYQFAYGSKGDKLKDKKLLPSLTIGQQEQNYKKYRNDLMDNLLEPVKISALYAQMEYLPPKLLYGVSPVVEEVQAKIKTKAQQHGQQLVDIINKYN